MSRSSCIATTLFASVLLVTGCAKRGDPVELKRPIVGLESGAGMTFTSAPDGSAMSILYDTASIVIPAGVQMKPGESKMQSRSFRLVLGGAPRRLLFEVRGFRAAAKPEAVALTFKVGDKVVDLTSELHQEHLVACFEIEATEPLLDVSWTGTVRHIPGEEGRLDVDSIDISALPGDAAKGRDCE